MTRAPALAAVCLLVAGCYWDHTGQGSDGGADADGSGGKADDTGGGDDDADGAVAGLFDAAPPDGAPALDPVPFGPFAALSESGLYVDIDGKILRPDLLLFEPEFRLWSDRADKTRWIWIPPGSQVNTATMSRWQVPVGTTAWKEFRDPDTGKRLETRVIQRLPSDACGSPPCFYFASFVWNADDSDAPFDATTSGNRDIPSGCSACASPPCSPFPDSCHVIPRQNQCNNCHGGEADKLLGFSAVQLSHDGPHLTIDDLVDLNLLTSDPPGGVTYPVPGTPVERAALGYLHANCGHCHHAAAGQQNCYGLTAFQTRVRPGDDTVAATLTWQTGVDQNLAYWVDDMAGNHTEPLITKRIAPGDHGSSAVWYRMSVREWGQVSPYDDHQQMPTIGTHEVDTAGLGSVETWIDSL